MKVAAAIVAEHTPTLAPLATAAAAATTTAAASTRAMLTCLLRIDPNTAASRPTDAPASITIVRGWRTPGPASDGSLDRYPSISMWASPELPIPCLIAIETTNGYSACPTSRW